MAATLARPRLIYLPFRAMAETTRMLFELGGVSSYSVWVKWTAVQNYGRIFDFGNGPNQDNILLSFDGDPFSQPGSS